ncbi:endonuclease domain-containing protein [Aeromonas veronii]|uniref:endonuclease domain-containing protein n=1 Tax=Aeromonas veronii TaxID=654 RepID=UPI00366E9B80
MRKKLQNEQLNLCPLCNRTLVKPCVDHAHIGEPHEHRVRGALCSQCNTTCGSLWKVLVRSGTVNKLGIQDAVSFLNNVASYYSKDYTDRDYHPNRLKDEAKAFQRLSKSEQLNKLLHLEILTLDQMKNMTKEQLLIVYKEYLAR